MSFLRIAITMPDEVPDEALKIASLLESSPHATSKLAAAWGGLADVGNDNYDYLHIRKPDWDERQIRRLIEAIPSELYHRLKLHSFFHLVEEYGLGGCHLNHRWPDAPADCKCISHSFHSIDEINKYFSEENIPIDCYQYVTLSPIFDSISKQGYLSAFDLDKIDNIRKELRPNIAEKVPPILALGGVTPDKFPLLYAKGFSGAALLGHAWKGINSG